MDEIFVHRISEIVTHKGVTSQDVTKIGASIPDVTLVNVWNYIVEEGKNHQESSMSNN